ncbi:hypothetical protein [Agrobacterium tumefaciens]|uniref:hypothetical protein n=1 Tax=Agrobacterium tumefaciens TaxID=358 RepID=UPI00278A3D98|nr:hypothetical protein [Agrobacterium tumefaciens]MDP9871583.1 hypothetical protein [Agrobacterium tumefaciens]MDP9976696.1 hypothetical protein [Agrobacterium tumefaciens]
MQNKKIAELLHEYFELGVAEGREGRNHDTQAGDAQRVLSEIEAVIAALSAAEPQPAPSVAVKTLADAYQKYLDAVQLYNERHAIMKTKALGTMRVDEEYKAIDESRRAFDKLAVEVACAALSAQVEDVAGSVIKLGAYGRAYDRPEERRAYTYEHQPGNIEAHKLGRACSDTPHAGSKWHSAFERRSCNCSNAGRAYQRGSSNRMGRCQRI